MDRILRRLCGAFNPGVALMNQGYGIGCAKSISHEIWYRYALVLPPERILHMNPIQITEHTGGVR